MNVQLTPSWILTDDNSYSSSGHKPVLVNKHESGVAYGPGDILQAYPSWPLQPASMTVERMAKTKELILDERLFVDDFINAI
jgi:hypothetical protein